jgi:hypothetical protein
MAREFYTTVDLKGNPLKGVSLPVDGTDAANKDYVDARVGGGGGGGGGLDQATADDLYVNVTGDTVTGPLIITDTGNLEVQGPFEVDTTNGSGLSQIYAGINGTASASISADSPEGDHYFRISGWATDQISQAVVYSTGPVFIDGSTLNLTSVNPLRVEANDTTHAPQRITNLADPTDLTDAVTKQYVDSKVGTGSTAPERATSTVTAINLMPNDPERGGVNLAKGYRLYRIDTTEPCRFRLYTTVAKRDADINRPIDTDPVGDHGLVLEFISAYTLLGADLSPVVDGFDGMTPPDGHDLPYTVTNTGSSTATFTVTLTWISSERTA